MRQTDLGTLQARDLRQRLTEAERIMWFALRDRRFMGLKFRRQVPIGPFIVDFLCVERRLIVEIVGGRSDDGTDVERGWLAAQGFVVLQMTQGSVLTNLPGCLEHLAERMPHGRL